MNRIWKSVLLILFSSLLLILPGCGHDTPSASKEIVLVAGRDLSPGEKDPYYSTVILKTWESLIGISNDGQIQPQLAVSWESNPDKTEWIFHLRQGVIFQDGVQFDAEAVKENLYRVTHMGYKPSSFYGYLVDRIYPGLVRYEADDPYTVHLYFKKPVPMLIYRMAGWGSAMFSPKCINRETGDFTEIAKGTGPFQIVDRKADTYTILEPFDGYYGHKAEARRIRINVVTSPESRYSALKSGEAQGVLDIGGLTPIMVKDLEKSGNFNVNAAHSSISHYLSVNGGKYPFNDERMRKAINLAIDRDKIVKYYFAGFGTPTRSFLNSTNPFARIVEPEYNPEEAKRLAHEVLCDDRVEVKMLLAQYGLERYPYKVICEFIQSELKDLGLDMKIVMADGVTARQMMQRGDYDLAIGTRGLGNLDPTSLLQEFFKTGGTTNKASHFMYSNPRIDEDFNTLDTTYDVADRKVIYDDILQELLDHPAVVPLLEDENIAVSSKKIAGYDAAVYGVTLDKMHWAKEGEE